MSDGDYLYLKVFLIAGSLDKHTKVLVQNLTEINSAYDCDITVPVKPDCTKRIRVFSHRTNLIYDIKMAIPEGFQPKEKKACRDYICGYMGECGL
ncbi:unnamed protein product [Adineta steineri]|nr:unnamed protein product [Adineta steineri]